MKMVDPKSASAYLFKQMDGTYGHDQREMYPTKDYFRTNDVVAGPDSNQQAALNAASVVQVPKKPAVNYDNLTKDQAVTLF